uniref:Uncharacterized protein n=1 Tax=Globodera rostochiensis TaxID=31243 RepID=A0A914I0S4_GLORO
MSIPGQIVLPHRLSSVPNWRLLRRHQQQKRGEAIRSACAGLFRCQGVSSNHQPILGPRHPVGIGVEKF